jgi:hypothetical protein
MGEGTMIAARFHGQCPGCDEPIERGDMIGRIGLAYNCAECVEAFDLANRMAPKLTVAYPVSSMFEAE